MKNAIFPQYDRNVGFSSTTMERFLSTALDHTVIARLFINEAGRIVIGTSYLQQSELADEVWADMMACPERYGWAGVEADIKNLGGNFRFIGEITREEFMESGLGICENANTDYIRTRFAQELRS